MNVARVSLFLLMALALVFAAYVPLGAVEHPPDINPDNFTPRQPINNPYFPLPVGRLFVYEGTKEGVPTHDEICVTGQTRVIEGVQATVVHHQSFEGNPRVLVEDTRDFHAQDIFHNVWYLGEDTIEIPSGSTEGSWESGVNDAEDRKSTRLNSSHDQISYAVFCLKKKKKKKKESKEKHVR